jgi:hypothetical protein
MNAPYRDQSIKVTVHFAPRKDGGLMVWSEHWRGLTRSTERSASTPAVPLRFGKKRAAQLGVPAELWQQAFAVRVGCAVGATAWVRRSQTRPRPGRAMLPLPGRRFLRARGQRQLRSRFIISSVG